MNPIKEAFSKIKEDIFFLKQEINALREEVKGLKTQTEDARIQTVSLQKSDIPTNNQTAPQEIKGLYKPNIAISTGNKGVQTDISTYQQTARQTDNLKENSLDKLQETLNSLDSIKKEIRIKFKGLTKQEMAVFSTIYILEDKQVENITYKAISSYMGLSESSIRDYVNKIIQKRIPLKKTKVNNKNVNISIDPFLKRTVTLSTINTLRDI